MCTALELRYVILDYNISLNLRLMFVRIIEYSLIL